MRAQFIISTGPFFSWITLNEVCIEIFEAQWSYLTGVYLWVMEWWSRRDMKRLLSEFSGHRSNTSALLLTNFWSFLKHLQWWCLHSPPRQSGLIFLRAPCWNWRLSHLVISTVDVESWLQQSFFTNLMEIASCRPSAFSQTEEPMHISS